MQYVLEQEAPPPRHYRRMMLVKFTRHGLFPLPDAIEGSGAGPDNDKAQKKKYAYREAKKLQSKRGIEVHRTCGKK